MQELLFALWFFAPAGIANLAPLTAKRIKLLDKTAIPIDAGKTYRGKRIFGDHKTYRGFIAGVISAFLTAGVQMILATQFTWFQELSSTINYSSPIVLLLGVSIGFGALFGDAIKSFFKRQIGVPAGKSWFPFDQTDYIFGGIIFSLPFVLLPFSTYIIILVVWFIIHLVNVYIGWLLHIRQDPI